MHIRQNKTAICRQEYVFLTIINFFLRHGMFHFVYYAAKIQKKNGTSNHSLALLFQPTKNTKKYLIFAPLFKRVPY
jgi:hypothetical protein